MLKEYNTNVQKLFLEMMIQDAQSYVRIKNIYNSENFDRSLRSVAEFIESHSDKHKTLPTYEQINATTGIKLKHVPDMNDGHSDWFLTEFEAFTKKQELERAILKSADLLEAGDDFLMIEKLIKDAVQISLTKDMGTDYFENPRERLLAIKSNNGQVSTGWPTLDKRLFGGMKRGELNIFACGSGSGKSLFMQNIALNWVTAGLNGVYLSLELSEGLCAMRMDSMMAEVSTKDVFRELDMVDLKVKMIGKKSGDLRIKYMPAQSNVNQIRSYLKELHIQSGVKPDFIMVDYLDLVMPVSAKVSPNDLFVKDKYVSEELRNLAKEFNILMVTASQLNRCLSLSTNIEVNGKITTIDKIQVGDFITSNTESVQVLEVLPIVKQAVFEITTKSGKKIKCSAKHKFPTSAGLQSLESGLKIGTKLIIKK